MASSDDVVKLVLRLPRQLHRRLAREAKQSKISLNTLLITKLEGAPGQQQLIAETVGEVMTRFAMLRASMSDDESREILRKLNLAGGRMGRLNVASDLPKDEPDED